MRKKTKNRHGGLGLQVLLLMLMLLVGGGSPGGRKVSGKWIKYTMRIVVTSGTLLKNFTTWQILMSPPIIILAVLLT